MPPFREQWMEGRTKPERNSTEANCEGRAAPAAATVSEWNLDFCDLL